MAKLETYVKDFTTDDEKEYATYQLFEQMAKYREHYAARAQRLRERLSEEKALTVEKRILEAIRSIEIEIEKEAQVTPKLDVPQFLTVREVSKLKGISMQMVRRHLIDKNYEGYQVAGENSTWRIPAAQFKDDPNWETFLKQRQETIERSKKAVEAVIEFWENKNPEADGD